MLMIDAFLQDFADLNVGIYKDIVNVRVKPRREAKEEYQYASCELIRFLCYCDPNESGSGGTMKEIGGKELMSKRHSWYMDFLHTCTKNVRNATILAYIDPNFNIKLDHYMVALWAYINQSIFDGITLLSTTKEITTFRKSPSAASDGYFAPIDRDGEDAILRLRGYQEELARFAREGANTVICAPTGSGKTIVAIEVIRSHLVRRNTREDGTVEQRSRVAFIVPTVPLVEQQARKIRTYLGGQYKVVGFSGGKNLNMNKRAFDILDSQIIISTPQMLVNSLRSIDENTRLYISDFTLFVLDECHHTGQKHPYEELMKMVRKFVGDGSKSENPQVVGLTASIGTRKAQNTEQVERHIFELCVNMLAKQISTVRSSEGIRELYSYVHPPEDETCSSRRSKDDKFRDVVCGLMGDIANTIREDVEIIREGVPRLKDLSTTIETSDPNFSKNFIGRLEESIRYWPRELVLAHQSKVAIAIQYMKIYAGGLHLNDLLPAFYAADYIKEKIKDVPEDDRFFFKQSYFDKQDQIKADAKEEADAMKNNEGKKEILKNLVEIITKAYDADNETRAMIFVQTRQMALYLSNYLNNCSALKRFKGAEGLSSHFTSTNIQRVHGGTSKSEQEKIIDTFAGGRIKILVTTSVAEEGLDIQACNLIIKYNTVGSERTMIQRRGRARSMNSKSVLICLDGDIERREIDNIERERMLKECIEHLQAISVNQLASRIEERRQEIAANKKKVTDELKRKMDGLNKKVFKLKCKICDRELCTSEYIRSILDSQYCCVDPTIWEKVNFETTETPSKNAFFVTCGPIKCKGDGRNACQTIGNVIKFTEVYLPALLHASLVIEEKFDSNDPSRKPEHPDKMKDLNWSKMKDYFIIMSIKNEDMLQMAGSLHKASPEAYERVKEETLYAIHRSIEKIKMKKRRKIRYNLDNFDQNPDDE